MKLDQLKAIIDKLENDQKDGVPMFAITVEDTSNADNVFNIITNATNPELVSQFGSAANFFENLYKSNTKSIRILPRKRNGTFAKGTKVNWKPSTTIQPEVMTFVPADISTPVESPKSKEVAPVFEHQNYHPMLNGSGLSGADFHKIYDHRRLESENIELKTKNEQLLSDNQRLKEEVLRNELLGTKSVEKSKAQAELLEKGQGYLPIVAEIIKSLRPASPTASLGQPQQQFSEVKNIFLNQDDDFLLELIPVAKALENQDFADKLTILLTEFNTTENAGN